MTAVVAGTSEGSGPRKFKSTIQPIPAIRPLPDPSAYTGATDILKELKMPVLPPSEEPESALEMDKARLRQLNRQVLADP